MENFKLSTQLLYCGVAQLVEVCFCTFCRLLDELNISSKTGMLCIAVLTQYS